MSYAKYDGNRTWVADEDITAALLNAWVNGVQDEIEERMEFHLLNGVISGFALTADDANDEADIAAGEAICEGKRFTGSASVPFTAGDASDTWYIYIDPTDEASPYKKATSDPGAGYMVIGTVDWDGASTLDAAVDLRPWGILPADIIATVPGTLATGVKLSIPVLRDLWIESVTIGLAVNGTTSGATTVDVSLGADGAAGTTIFTTQSNRPSIAYDDAEFTVGTSGTPDGDRKPDAGEHLDIEVDAIPGGSDSAGLTVVVKARLR